VEWDADVNRTLVSATVLGKESQGLFWHHDVLFP
jgi:hypothetical protein